MKVLMKKIIPFLIGFAILFVLLFLVILFDRPAPPNFSMQSGYYTEPFTLKISSMGQNETIHYTLDGSMPTLESPIYTEPLLIENRSNDPNDISMITTISYGYVEPEGIVNKINVVRARSFNNFSKTESSVVTHSFLVDEDIENRYSLPIFSLVVEPKDLFDQRTGIYVTGKGPERVAREGDRYYFWPANYHERGQDWERPVFVQYFDTEGNLEISQNAGVRIHGGASRSYRQKSFRLYADRKYDDVDHLNYFSFPNLFNNPHTEGVTEYETLTLRNSGTDFFSSFMRDVLIQRLVEHTSAETQANKPVIVFLNGEYWGLYFLYERYDQGYFKNYYDIDSTNLIVLEQKGDVTIGVTKDQEIYKRLLGFVSTHNVTDAEVFSDISNQIDLDNFIDYQITQIFIAHQDWPQNNIKFWRSRVATDETGQSYGHDGRWRWLVFDTDHGFTHTELNAMVYATREDLDTLLLRTLVHHPEFQVQFLNRFADHLNSTFQTDRVLQEIDQLHAILEPEMPEQIDRWHSSGASMEQWQRNVNFLRSFARQRPAIMIQDLVEYFDLDGTFTLALESNTEMGYVQVNSIAILPSTPGIGDVETFEGIYFKNIPISLTAIPYDGYQFSHWVGTTNHLETDLTIEISTDTDIYLQPVFIPID